MKVYGFELNPEQKVGPTRPVKLFPKNRPKCKSFHSRKDWGIVPVSSLLETSNAPVVRRSLQLESTRISGIIIEPLTY